MEGNTRETQVCTDRMEVQVVDDPNSSTLQLVTTRPHTTITEVIPFSETTISESELVVHALQNAIELIRLIDEGNISGRSKLTQVYEILCYIDELALSLPEPILDLVYDSLKDQNRDSNRRRPRHHKIISPALQLIGNMRERIQQSPESSVFHEYIQSVFFKDVDLRYKMLNTLHRMSLATYSKPLTDLYWEVAALVRARRHTTTVDHQVMTQEELSSRRLKLALKVTLVALTAVVTTNCAAPTPPTTEIQASPTAVVAQVVETPKSPTAQPTETSTPVPDNDIASEEEFVPQSLTLYQDENLTVWYYWPEEMSKSNAVKDVSQENLSVYKWHMIHIYYNGEHILFPAVSVDKSQTEFAGIDLQDGATAFIGRNPEITNPDIQTQIRKVDSNSNCHSVTFQILLSAIRSDLEPNNPMNIMLQQLLRLPALRYAWGNTVGLQDFLPRTDFFNEITNPENIRPGDIAAYYDAEGRLTHTAFVSSSDTRFGKSSYLGTTTLSNQTLVREYGPTVRYYKPNPDLFDQSILEATLAAYTEDIGIFYQDREAIRDLFQDPRYDPYYGHLSE